ncbi:MAG: hypothetical protein KC438_11955 [Thermomicrobiales bacterium]|nr:hypothetical protein [Thermomicrobiales bacterium]MCO5222702.1 hypothetical protein [Thermomicrobiales bacterium]
MHPQQPWLMRLNAEELQRDIERQMRMRQARQAGDRNQRGIVSQLRRSIGSALIAAGDRIQPDMSLPREHDGGIEVELAR